MKHVLYIGCNAGSESMPKYFREVCEYDEFIPDGNLKVNLQNYNRIPDIVFLQIQSPTIGDQNTCNFIGEEINRLKDKGSFVINWTGDKRSGVPRWMIDFAINCDVTAFSNEEDVNFIRKYGIKSLFLQQGIDTNIFKPEGEKAQCPEIVFLANNYGQSVSFITRKGFSG